MSLHDSVTRSDALCAALVKEAEKKGFTGEEGLSFALADAAFLAAGAATGSEYCLERIAALIEIGLALPGVVE